jgi:endo-1,4-beta-mannosidase
MNIAPRNFVNNRFLILNMHGMLFHERLADIQEDIYYASWMNAGVIRVFATDASGLEPWSGGEVAERIIEIAPMLRSANIKLIVALVNNHQEVPGEAPSSVGWMDGYQQLLLPFYSGNWRAAYRSFASDLIWLVKERGARDVIWAWEVGNEVHTQQDPPLVLDFLHQAIDAIRQVDDVTQILPGTMGSNHLEPWAEDSPIARELFCDMPVSAYTLHAYDWRDIYNGGDMPIQYDFAHTVRERCNDGGALPVIVEELGTSRAVPGQYSEWEEDKRLAAELNQIRYVLSQPSVAAVGAWSAESPRSRRVRHDRRRGLTSYGPEADGYGSCYSATADNVPGARCRLEQVLRSLPNVP